MPVLKRSFFNTEGTEKTQRFTEFFTAEAQRRGENKTVPSPGARGLLLWIADTNFRVPTHYSSTGLMVIFPSVPF